jgi:endonuclease/exonuclease/phosphatase family metal-dependent hydrolase
MTYNIQAGRGWDIRARSAARPRRLDRVADVIRSAAPDIVALQEVDRDQGAELARLLGMNVCSIASITGGDRRDYGMATLTRVPVLASRELVLPQRVRGPRSALVTRHAWRGGELDLVNTHLSMMFHDRPGQAAALTTQLAGGALVVAGDFNMTPISPAYRMLARGFHSATRFARTWPAPAAVMPIDHVLYRGLRLIRGEAWTGGGARTASDHLPVVAELAGVT